MPNKSGSIPHSSARPMPIVAGEQGFEPQLVDPESTVLPIKLFPTNFRNVLLNSLAKSAVEINVPHDSTGRVKEQI